MKKSKRISRRQFNTMMAVASGIVWAGKGKILVPDFVKIFNLKMKFPIVVKSLLFALLFCSCNYENNYEKVLGGNHELRKFNVKTTTSEHSSAWYFLVMGGYSSGTSSFSKVRFYFKNYKGEFQLMELLLDEVNVKIDSTITTPYVRFYWENRRRDEDEWNAMYKYDVTRAVIYCRENDFQPEININDLR